MCHIDTCIFPCTQTIQFIPVGQLFILLTVLHDIKFIINTSIVYHIFILGANLVQFNFAFVLGIQFVFS